MAAAEEKCDMMTIADIDEQLAKQLTDELFEKGFIKKGKASDVTSVINDFKIMKPKTPANFNGKKPDRDATLIKKLIPFAGGCIDGRCQALNNNHGLFNQCDKKPVGKSLYCKGCNSPNATSGLTKVQTCGTVQDRIDQYEEHGDLNKYKTPTNEITDKNGDPKTKKGVCAKPLGKVLHEINKKRENDGKVPITIEQIQEEASKVDIEIPEECLEVPVSKRGRKAGSKNSTPASSDGETPKKKQRGRPKKNNTVEQAAEQLSNLTVNEDEPNDDENDDEISDEEEE